MTKFLFVYLFSIFVEHTLDVLFDVFKTTDLIADLLSLFPVHDCWFLIVNKLDIFFFFGIEVDDGDGQMSAAGFNADRRQVDAA